MTKTVAALSVICSCFTNAGSPSGRAKKKGRCTINNFIFDLQLFAEAGSLVNASTGFVNAGSGEQEDFSDTHSLSPEMKKFYDTELLENARTELF